MAKSDKGPYLRSNLGEGPIIHGCIKREQSNREPSNLTPSPDHWMGRIIQDKFLAGSNSTRFPTPLLGSVWNLTQFREYETFVHQLTRIGHNNKDVSKQFDLLLILGDEVAMSPKDPFHNDGPIPVPWKIALIRSMTSDNTPSTRTEPSRDNK
jgi:hypothetical protein